MYPCVTVLLSLLLSTISLCRILKKISVYKKPYPLANVVNRALLEKIFGKISIITAGCYALLYVLQYSLKWGGVKVIYHWHLNDKLQYYRSIPWMKIHWNWNVPPIFFYQCVDRIVKLFCFVLCFVLFGVFFLSEASLWQIVRTRNVPATNRPYMRPV